MQPSRLRATLSPSYPITTPVFLTMTTQTQLNPTSTNTQTTTSTAFQQRINNVFQSVLRRAPPPLGGGGGRGDGGGRGGGGSGGGGGGPPGGPDPALQPVAQAADVQAIGKIP